MKAAAPIGASSIICKGEQIRSGLFSFPSHFSSKLGILKFETLKPQRPAFGFAPLPVAPSSLISPPEPVEAPGKGEMAVGWLCVSTFVTKCIGSSSAL